MEVHTATLLRMNKPAASVSPADRERTKRIVYASLYGARVRRLMGILDVGYEQALAVQTSFNSTRRLSYSFYRITQSETALTAGLDTCVKFRCSPSQNTNETIASFSAPDTYLTFGCVFWLPLSHLSRGRRPPIQNQSKSVQ